MGFVQIKNECTNTAIAGVGIQWLLGEVFLPVQTPSSNKPVGINMEGTMQTKYIH